MIYFPFPLGDNSSPNGGWMPSLVQFQRYRRDLERSWFRLNHAVVPAEAGTQRLAKELGSRLRGSERSLFQRNAMMH